MVMVPATIGVDLNEDKLRLQPGTLRDCLNFECAYRSGYSRTEGMRRFDGRELLEDMEAYRSVVTAAPGGPAYGLHFFTDRFNDQSWLFAVVESTRIALNGRPIPAESLQVEGQRVEIYVDTPTGFPNAWVLESNASFAGETRDLIEVLIDPGVEVFSGDIVAYTRVSITNGEELPAVGDQITDPVSGWTATVRGATLISGSALTLDISAELWVEIDTPGGVGVNAILERVSDSQVIGLLQSADGYSENGVLAGQNLSFISDIGADVDRGVLIRSGARGWEVVQQSYEARFIQGANEPSNVYANGSQVALNAPPTALPAESAGTASFNDTGVARVDWDLDDAAMRDAIQSDDASFVEATIVDEDQLTEQIRLSGFSTDLDELDEVTGIAFEVICEKASGSMDVTVNGMQSQSGAVRGTGTVVDAKATLTFGSPTDLWGASSINDLRANVLNPNYTWFLDFIGRSTDVDSVVRVYTVRRIVYLREGSLESVLYLRSGGTDYQARCTYVSRTEGEWSANDAEGFITLARIDNPALIPADAQIRTEPGGGGDLVARLDGSLSPIRLPSRARLALKKSKFEFLDTNFFASGRFRAVYGVSGAGHAFTFNNNYLFRIRTGRTEDEPRHVARHKERLVLGYENGDADFSVNANPDLYDGILNAFSLGFGDRVVGLMPLDGETLGVWTDKSIWGVQGTNIEDVIQQVVSAESGAIEYTVRDAGQVVFTNKHGVSTVASAATYGDFADGTLSLSIRPWLQPRLQGDPADGKRPIMAEAVPKKNQYRLWFADGYVATLTLDQQQPPKWTFQRPYMDVGETPLTVITTTHGVDEDFRPRSFAAFEGEELVQEIHAGSDYDGQLIRAKLVFNPVHANGAGKRIRVNTVHIHGICSGLVQLDTKIGVDYKLPEDTIYVGSTNMGEASQAEQEPVFAKVRHKARGRDFALQIETESVNDHTIQVLEFPNLSERRLER